MKPLIVDGFYSWSIFSEERQMDFNGYLWVQNEGNLLIDPVPMTDADLLQFNVLGGATQIVLTNRDHERDAKVFREQTGAEVVAHEAEANALSFQPDRTVAHEDEIVPGMRAIHLPHGKSPGEIALHLPEMRTIIMGDLVVGAPMGKLTLLSDEKLEHPTKAAVGLRRLLRHDFDVMLVGDGHSIFHDARDHLLDCLEARTDIYINRINVEDLDEGFDAEIGALIGARNLGYQLYRIKPGQFICPFHFHHFDEEMAFVMEGECTLRTDRGEFTVRQGDFIAFPAGERGVHKFTNNGTEPCVLFLLGEEHPYLICEYPDSDTIKTRVVNGAFRKRDVVDYLYGET